MKVFCVHAFQYSDETLAVFKSYKLDDTQASKKKLEELRTAGGEHVYFAKFLTSEKVANAYARFCLSFSRAPGVSDNLVLLPLEL